MKKIILDFKEVLKDFLDFLKKPKEINSVKKIKGESSKIFTILFFFQIVWLFIFVFPISGLLDAFYPIPESKLLDLSIYQMLLFGCIVAPLLEETIFRLPLRFKRNYFVRLLNKISGGTNIKFLWDKFYGIVFYLSAFIFGAIHAFNFDEEPDFIFYLLIPLLTISQICTGIILGYVRLKLSFLHGVLFHAIFNFTVIMVPYLIANKDEIINIKTSDMQIEMESLIFKEQKISIFSSIKNDTVYEIKANSIDFPFLMKTIYDREYTSDDVKNINFKLESKKGIHKKELFKILRENMQLDSIDN